MSKHILVVANQTIGGASLLELVNERAKEPDRSFTLARPTQTAGGASLPELVKERAKEPDTSFTLVVPMSRPRSGYVIYDDAVRESAQVRLGLTPSHLRGAGGAGRG